MRLEVIALLALSTCQLALACCGNKGVTSCCGNGKCNIFCCNCDGGCNKSCKPIELPLCWAWEGGYICDNPDGSTSMSGVGGPKVPKPKPERLLRADVESPMIARTGAMGDKPDDEVTTEQQSEGKTRTITRVFPPSEDEDEDDATMHQAVDGHGKGFFTFNEFLRYLGEDKTPELVDHFDKYDMNGDGVITPDEMRLPD